MDRILPGRKTSEGTWVVLEMKIYLRELLKDSILGLILFLLFINDLQNIQ